LFSRIEEEMDWGRERNDETAGVERYRDVGDAIPKTSMLIWTS